MRMSIVLSAVLLLSVFAVALPASAGPSDPLAGTCVGKPTLAQACVGRNNVGAACVSAGVGLQGGFVCVGPSGDVRVCTSMYTALYGNCPTDLVPDVSVVDRVCVGKPSIAQSCVGHNDAGAVCYWSSAGLQGAGICVYPDGEVRACTTAYTALYGYCPTDLVIG
jgi:hypothetical protein